MQSIDNREGDSREVRLTMSHGDSPGTINDIVGDLLNFYGDELSTGTQAALRLVAMIGTGGLSCADDEYLGWAIDNLRDVAREIDGLMEPSDLLRLPPAPRYGIKLLC